jgi:hypothetical protein
MADENEPNEVTLSSGRKIAVGSEWWDIRKDDAPCCFVDFITEARQFNGTVYLGLGSGIVEPNNTAVVDVVSRLRMNLGTAQAIHSLLGQMISDALKPVDHSKAN